MTKKTFVIDTNVIIRDPNFLEAFSEDDVVLPMIVLEELDKIKDRRSRPELSYDARLAIRNISTVLENRTPREINEGVPLSKGGTLRIYQKITKKQLNGSGVYYLDTEAPKREPHPDNIIINVALTLQEGGDKNVILVTNDINMQIKARSAGLSRVQIYLRDKIIDDLELLPSGVIDFDIFSTNFKREGKDILVPVSELPDCYLNGHIRNGDKEKIFCIRDIEGGYARVEEKRISQLMEIDAFGIKPRSLQQALAIDALLDPNISNVNLLGPAGTGKTLLALACGIEMVLSRGLYDRIIIARSIANLDEDIGFLPGTEEEKMMPWLGAFTDALEYIGAPEADEYGDRKNGINNNTQLAIEHLIERAHIQYRTINYMRGRSFLRTLIILDETQSLTPFQMKTMLTRVGEGSKIVCLGNLAQIDSKYITAFTSGLTYCVDKLKEFDGSSSVILEGVVRSRLAEFAEKNL